MSYLEFRQNRTLMWILMTRNITRSFRSFQSQKNILKKRNQGTLLVFKDRYV